jgi:hypothetical protein
MTEEYEYGNFLANRRLAKDAAVQRNRLVLHCSGGVTDSGKTLAEPRAIWGSSWTDSDLQDQRAERVTELVDSNTSSGMYVIPDGATYTFEVVAT